ncbi:hypothetical protein ACFOLC_15435 [Lysobacter cavernae]|uniref:3-dehydroquinate dehydratase n=1 Tax=Lysobacter cavernae TaxID=1685901 RepID=A0ABV7RUS0_9GAMM
MLAALMARSYGLGKTLLVQTCANVRELVERLRGADERTTELVLLDPGELALQLDAGSDTGLRGALDALAAPYIEVHDDSATALEPRLQPLHMPLATVIINRNLAEGYRLALGIALRRLGRQDTASPCA